MIKVRELEKHMKTKEILKGMIIGEEENQAVVSYEGQRIYILSVEMGGEQKEFKIQSLLGAMIEFLVTQIEGEIVFGSRKDAMEIRKTAMKDLAVGSISKGVIILIKPKFLLVEALGEEILVPVRKCLSNWCEDLNDEFEIGQEVEVVLESKTPIEVSLIDPSLEKEWNAELLKKGSDYVGEVKSIAPQGIFVKVEDRLVLCREVTFRNPPKVGDKVVCEIEKVDPSKKRTWGFIKRVVIRR